MNNDLVELQTQLAQAQAQGQSAGYPITQTSQPASQMTTDPSQPYISQPQVMTPPYTPYRMAEPSEDERLPATDDEESLEFLPALIPAVVSIAGMFGKKPKKVAPAPVVVPQEAKILGLPPIAVYGIGGLLTFVIIMKALK